ncbi:MAG: cytochrome c oxidase subunit 3 [Moheibacter sp.]
MEVEQQNSKSIFYPPGGILLWIVIYLELITFGMAMIAFVYYGMQEKEIFSQSAAQLSKPIATINTLFLLTSGFFIAKSVHSFKVNEISKTLRFMNFAMFTGLGFIILKCFEYYDKIEHGLTMGENSFYMYYWLLTAFHWIHVLVGLVILFFIKRSIKKRQDKYPLEDFEAGAAFWHMCDLIWLLLFPILYLLF